ncbi:DUF4102 domain-containing protein [Halotia branconii]|uniref:DUF4102 domain-containing protein n=1 Tax=Halotia branconii CENA392 TaxID=1539056 RepID=A0AAJ6NQK7_9CYAN|nr:DUF4102 domain-containing protein [Halotia branconii]WGV24772.1 DUF4102 domain-containing protein [Halotia branconii CENA392]
MTEQLTLFNFPATQTIRPLIDPYWDEITKQPDNYVGAQVSHTTPVESLVGAQVSQGTKKSAPQHDTQWVERYWVERSQNKYWYYRYCWMEGRKKQRVYIGAVHSLKAQHKKQLVEDAIADGQSPIEIKQLLRSY